MFGGEGEGEHKPRGVLDKVSAGLWWLCKKLLLIFMVILSILGVILPFLGVVYAQNPNIAKAMHPLDAHGFPHPPQRLGWPDEFY